MSIRSYGITIAMLLALVGSPSFGQPPSCFDPMVVPGRCLPWGYVDLAVELTSDYVIIDLSKDGSSVSGTKKAFTEFFRWRSDTNLDVLNLSTVTITEDRSIMTADGSKVVGRFFGDTGTVSDDRVFLWDVASGPSAYTFLPSGPANWITNAYPSRPNNGTVTPNTEPTISEDGNTIDGRGRLDDGNGDLVNFNLWPFRWTAASGTSDAPQEPFVNAWFHPIATAGNGARVAGRIWDSSFSFEGAAAWKPGRGDVIVPPYPAKATALTHDSELVVGIRSDSGPTRAFEWTESTGTNDFLANRFEPRAISDDGTVIAGFDYDDVAPWVWSQASGYQSLENYLKLVFGVAVPAPSYASIPRGLVSADGSSFAVLGEQWVVRTPPLNAVSLGDSFSSGEGAPIEKPTPTNPEYRAGSDTEMPENQCHRSNNSYGARMTPRSSTASFRELSDAAPMTGFDWKFVACSGAVVANVTRTGIGQYTEMAQLAQNPVNSDTDFVTITIGGNDSMFIPVLRVCLGEQDCHRALATQVQLPNANAGETVEQYVERIINQFVEMRVRTC